MLLLGVAGTALVAGPSLLALLRGELAARLAASLDCWGLFLGLLRDGRRRGRRVGLPLGVAVGVPSGVWAAPLALLLAVLTPSPPFLGLP